jgi:putative FmdB family regulatory protein
MPIYEYECQYCKNKYEEVSDTYTTGSLPDCKKCGNKMVKVFDKAPGVRFLGEGWWATEWGNQRHNCLGNIDEEAQDASSEWDDGEEG